MRFFHTAKNSTSSTIILSPNQGTNEFFEPTVLLETKNSENMMQS
jgi:hypothetical protein